MTLTWNPLLVAVCLVGGAIVLFGVGTLLFQAGCALADVTDKGYFRSLLIYSVAVVVCVPLAAALIWLAGGLEADPSQRFGTMRILATGVSLLAAWVLSAVIYALFLAAPFRKGLLIAGAELLLMALLAALLSAAVLVALAFVQIIVRPPPTHPTALAPVHVPAAPS